MVELDGDGEDSRVAALEQLIREERDRFAAEQRKAAAELAELTERITILTGHTTELEAENARLRRNVTELKQYRQQLRRIMKSPLYRPVGFARKLARRVSGGSATDSR